MKYFSTKDIIVIAMFGALGVIVGFLGNILHSASSVIPFIGPAILHTVPQAIVLFSCVCRGCCMTPMISAKGQS